MSLRTAPKSPPKSQARIRWTPGHTLGNGVYSSATAHGADASGFPWLAEVRRTGLGWQARFLDEDGQPTGRYSPQLRNAAAAKRWVREYMKAWAS